MSDESKKSFKDLLLKNFNGVQRGTEFVLKTIPPKQLDFAPANGMKKLGELAFHVATLPLTFTYFVQNNSTERPAPEDIKLLLSDQFGSEIAKNNYQAMFGRSCEYFLEFFKKHSDDELAQKTFTNFIYQTPTPLFSAFLSVEDHIIQHRGTIFAYLRILGIPVTMKQYFGIEPLD